MIKSIEDLQAIIPTISGENFGLYKGAVADAERWLKLRILSVRLFELTTTDERFDELASIVVAYRAYRDVIPRLDVINTGNGFIIVSDDHFSPASRDRVNALVASMDSALTESLAALYEYIEDTDVLRSAFEGFVGSTVIGDSLLPTLRDFRRYGQFDGGYQKWIDSRPKHLILRLRFFEPRFSQRFMDDVMANQDNDKYRHVVANLRYAFAAIFLDDAATYKSLCDAVERHLLTHLDEFPEYRPIAAKPFESTSIISFI